MGEFLLVWLGTAAALFGMELWMDVRARRQPFMAAFCAATWPVYIPLGVWVACNPKKAERIRLRYGTAGKAAPTPSRPTDVSKGPGMNNEDHLK